MEQIGRLRVENREDKSPYRSEGTFILFKKNVTTGRVDASYL